MIVNDETFHEISRARIKAHSKHGDQSIESISPRDPRWLAILVEEVGEAAHELTYDATGSLRAELIDVLAVASAWVDSIDRDAARRDAAGRLLCETCGEEVAYCGGRHKPTSADAHRCWHAIPAAEHECRCTYGDNHGAGDVIPNCAVPARTESR